MNIRLLTLPLVVSLLFLGACEPPPDPEAPPDDPQAAYAPRVDPPAEVREDPLVGEYARTADIAPMPTRGEVNIPPYPGSRLAHATRGVHLTTNDHEERALPMVVLLAPDAPAEVAAFYRQELQGWQEREVGASTWFWEGPEDFEPASPEAAETPSVHIIEARSRRAQLMDNTQTEIEIRYQPAGQQRQPG